MARKRRTRHGDGTYWYDEKERLHRFRIIHEGKAYTVSSADRTRAEGKLARLKEELAKQIDRDGSKQLLCEFLPYWLDQVVARDVRSSTLSDYRKRCEIYITPSLGNYRLRDLTVPLIRRWANAVRDNYALNSAKQALGILTRALQVAVEEKLIEYNPAASVDPPRERHDETKIDETQEDNRSLSPEQATKLLDEVKRTDAHHTTSKGARSIGMYVLYVLALRLGLRRGELLGLRWKDIDFDEKVLHVRQQVIRVEKEIKITTPKSPKSRRSLPLSDDLVSMLREHKLKIGALGYVDDLVFPDEQGNRRRPDSIDRHFRRACDRIELNGFVFHDLRATAITRWREVGIDLEVAAALAGHSTIKVTGETYSDATMDRKRAAIEKTG